MKNNILFILISVTLLFTSCEEEFIPEDGVFIPKYVVEGFIEDGEGAFPPYVLLTRTFPFYGDVNSDILDSLIVKGAHVSITEEDGKETELTELCINDIPDDLRDEIAKLLGIGVDSTGQLAVDICAYIDLYQKVKVEAGKLYELNIDINNVTLHAVTTIPEHVPLDSVWFTQPPGDPNDSLAEMNCLISDPIGPNFYRFLTGENSGPVISTFGSVTDDKFFDGQEFAFPINKAEDPNDPDIDFETFGLWYIGDTSTLKWVTIDEDHFNFWQTFEFNRNNQGPFSTYTRVAHNIEGGIGIWGGLSSTTYTQIVKTK